MDVSTLNPAQRAAVMTPSGPLLVLAGAGTGKTRVVTYRIAELIRHGTPANRILAVTFTNKAAAEMHTRAMELLGKAAREKPEISTFHSLCVRILRRHAPRLGYPAQFAIYDRGDQESAARAALREIKVSDEVMRPADLINAISRWKMQSVRPDAAASLASDDKQHLASMAYRRYQTALKRAGAVDFDDLLLCTEELFARFADVRQSEAARYRHLLIDEYQDTNASQYRIVRALASGHRNLCVVGDDDQSIYGWRGAEVAHILRFQRDWPEATVVRLEDNYRSSASILELANRLIRHNKKRHDKTLRPARPGGQRPQIVQCKDETAEAKMVVGEIAGRVAAGTAPRDFAILFRTNEQPRLFEMELRRAKMPYVLVGGMSFYDRREVRDILAYIKLLVAPHDEIALRRVINTPARGIGAKAQEALLAEAVTRGVSLHKILAKAESVPGLGAGPIAAIGDFQKLIEQFRRRLEQERPVAVVSDLIRRIDYQGEIARTHKDPQDQQSRWSAVEEVVNALATYEKRAKRPGLQGFLDEVLLGDRDDDRTKEQQLSRNAIALMTLHSAKGLEFPQVYLVGMEEGLLPHRRSVELEGAAIDEERRLCYVGITRARDRLTISLALGRTKWGKLRPTEPSRFLYEITGKPRPVAPRNGSPRTTRREGTRSGRVAPPAAAARAPASGGKGPRRRPSK